MPWLLHPAAVHEGILAIAAEPGLPNRSLRFRAVTCKLPVLAALSIEVFDAKADVFLGIVDQHHQCALRPDSVSGCNPLGDFPVQRQRVDLAARIVVGQAKAHHQRGLDQRRKRADQFIAGHPEDGLVEDQIGLGELLAVVDDSFHLASAAFSSSTCSGVARSAASEADIGSMARRNSNSARTSPALIGPA